MRRLHFAALLSLVVGPCAWAQRVPGRDLLAYPIALTAEPPALALQSGTGFWNPASALLPDGRRWRAVAATMTAPVDVDVSAQLLGLSRRLDRATTVQVSVARAAVGGLLRTDSDPQSIGSEIPYGTTVLSLGAARRVAPHLVLGAAIRRRSGELDDVRAAAWATDVGVVADGLLGPRRDLRVGASTFLGRAFGGRGERSGAALAVDARLAGNGTEREVRGGASLFVTDGTSREAYGFGSARWGRLEARGGLVRTTAFGRANTRLRLGATLHHRGYAVGVAREDGAGGMAGTWQFTLSSLFR